MTYVLICDDDETQAEQWATQLRSAVPSVSVSYLAGDDLAKEIDALTGRHVAAREKRQGQAPQPEMRFDEVDVLVLDYDLLGLESNTTGARLAYLSRCYTTAKMIVVLNEFGSSPTFDLDFDSRSSHFADLHLAAAELSFSGLWDQTNWGPYRPWHWPLIPRFLEQLSALTKLIAENIDRPILEVLQFPMGTAGDVVPYLSRDVVEYLLPGSSEHPDEVRGVTFNEFLDKSPGGLKRRDAVPAPQRPRIAAARLLTWLERVVLPSQDVLVDAPHLVSRIPSLLDGDTEDLDTWNACCSLGGTSSGLQPNDRLNAASFGLPSLLSRPAWYWPLLAGDESFPEIASPWTKSGNQPAFCEDASRFVPRSSARDFLTRMSSLYARRFAAAPSFFESFPPSHPAIKYTPTMNFAL